MFDNFDAGGFDPSMMQWYDYMRLTSILLLFAVQWMLALRLKRTWKDTHPIVQDLGLAFGACLFLVMEITIENLWMDNEYGPRILFTLVFALFALRVVWRISRLAEPIMKKGRTA